MLSSRATSLLGRTLCWLIAFLVARADQNYLEMVAQSLSSAGYGIKKRWLSCNYTIRATRCETYILTCRNLASGTHHHVWYGLTYDLTAIYTPMGTYPSFAFTPNDE